MKNLQFDEIIAQLKNLVEDKGSVIVDEADSLTKTVRKKYDIYKLENQLNNEYKQLGKLTYELLKLDKEVKSGDVGEKLRKIEILKDRIEELNIQVDREEDIFVNEDEEYEKPETENVAQVVCDNCGHLNNEYVAYCSNCGKRL